MRFGYKQWASGSSAGICQLWRGRIGAIGSADERSHGVRDDHPPGETVSDPIKIVFFKKEACDNPPPQGLRCTFDVKVSSRNIGASMYNNISFAVF
jgi:hypothetical protein